MNPTHGIILTNDHIKYHVLLNADNQFVDSATQCDYDGCHAWVSAVLRPCAMLHTDRTTGEQATCYANIHVRLDLQFPSRGMPPSESVNEYFNEDISNSLEWITDNLDLLTLDADCESFAHEFPYGTACKSTISDARGHVLSIERILPCTCPNHPIIELLMKRYDALTHNTLS